MKATILVVTAALIMMVDRVGVMGAFFIGFILRGSLMFIQLIAIKFIAVESKFIFHENQSERR